MSVPSCSPLSNPRSPESDGEYGSDLRQGSTGPAPDCYRLYDTGSQARTELVRTLRELGLDLNTIRRILDRRTTVADVARTHVEALDAEIRTLRLRRAVLWSVAERGSTNREMRTMHELARLSARERQQIIDDFVTQAFDGIPADADGARIARSMRQMPAELPKDPTAEQIEAWIELAELTADPAFRQRVREMALAGAATPEAGGDRAPESPAGREVLGLIVDPAVSAAERTRLADELETFTDRRVERYWLLIGIVNGRSPFSSGVPAFEWLIAALRAHV